MHVLIADDDRALNLLLAAAFRKRGWTVSIAVDAVQALATAMRGGPDVIVLDINMPGGTGLNVLRRLKCSVKTIHIPILVLSGSDPAQAAPVLELGAAQYLRKPTEPQEVCILAAQLAGVMDRVAQQAAAGQPGEANERRTP